MDVILKRSTVSISNDIEVLIDDRFIIIKGNNGVLTHHLHDSLNCARVKDELILSLRLKRKFINNKSLLGTTVSLLRSMLFGVSVGFVKKLQLIGVGYRAVLEKNIIILTVGFSHVVNYKLPNGVRAVCSSPTDIILNSANKQLIGQVAADLRSIRPPEAFSGKGIRYFDEVLCVKEVKKK